MKYIIGKIYRVILFIFLFLCGIFAQRIGLIDYLSDPYEFEYLIELTKQHVYLVSISMFLATILGLTVGILFSRKKFRRFSNVAMYIVSLGQTIPCLAVLAFAMILFGIGSTPAIAALFVYSALPIARNTLTGLLSVPINLIDAAKGIGLNPVQILTQVEIPNSMFVIITGFRIALVFNIGTAALGYIIGAGGLGDLIFTGINLMQPEKVLAGAIPTTLLALLADYLIGIIEFVVISKGLRINLQPA